MTRRQTVMPCAICGTPIRGYRGACPATRLCHGDRCPWQARPTPHRADPR